MGTAFEEMSSWKVLRRHLWINTTFYTNYTKSRYAVHCNFWEMKKKKKVRRGQNKRKIMMDFMDTEKGSLT